MDEKDKMLLYLLEEFIDFESLCINASLSHYELSRRLYILKNMGYQIEKSVREGISYYYLSKELHKRVPFPPIPIPKDFFRAIYISDTHYGSIFDNIHLVDGVLEYALLHNIHSIFHLGDFIEGTKYPDFMRIPDVMEQVFYTVENYPYDNSVQNYILFGNHDVYSVKQNGLDISKVLFNSRSDFSYLGCEEAMFQLYHSYVLLLHSLYSYRIIPKKQHKYNRLSLALTGHFHTFQKKWYKNCLELRLPSLSDDPRFSGAKAYDIIIPSNFEEIYLRQLTFEPNITMSSESTIKLRKKI